MDTGSESFRSQDTPNSTLSSDFDERSEANVLRLQNPENGVLRLSEPDNVLPKKELSDSFVTKMSDLHLESPLRPKVLGLSDAKKTALVLTTDHPLMITSPEDFPDVIPKKQPEDLSLSSIEDDHQTNGYSMYSPNINNSKNNLYYSENFTTAESFMSESNASPDVAKVTQQRRKIIPRFVESPPKHTINQLDNTPHRVLGRIVTEQRDESAITKYVEERNKKLTCHSTPKTSVEEDGDVNSRVAQWCESTQLRTGPKFDLPIELSTNVAVNSDLESPDVISSPSRSNRSLYEALLEPHTGRVALRPTQPRGEFKTQLRPSPDNRRKIQLPPEEDQCSLDSVSVSMESEEEPPELDPELKDPEPQVEHGKLPSDENIKRSKSTNSCSECSESDPIPEYSAAEEYHNERSYISVDTGGSHATCDMKVIEPYKRVLSHGGYDGQGSAIIVFSACFLPDTARTDYRYVMDNLFLYVMWTLERLIGEEYVLVYLHGSAGSRKLPSCRWLHECYRLIDRRLRKSLKHLYLVHPTFWLKSFVILTKPFVSSKFFRKISYVQNLDHLSRMVPNLQTAAIPDAVRQYDETR
ncbi:hypothetical protein O0L34_g13365 [Tuta absoluta]|nr:hypothetical protein O0L34_g13365 [Tuta absoluta]